MPTTDGQTNPDNDFPHINGIFERGHETRSPATLQDPFDSDDCIDLPTYVSLIAEQSKASCNIRSTKNLIPNENSAVSSLTEVLKLEESEEKEGLDEESSNPDPRNIQAESGDVAQEKTVPSLSSSQSPHIDCNNSNDESPAVHVKENNVQHFGATKDSDARESENNEDEPNIALPLGHSTDENSEDVPLISLPIAKVHPVIPPFFSDPKKEITHRGCLIGSKIIKRSSSVISDSGIESEPSSVAWPLDAVIRGRPPLDFSSEQEIPQQILSRHPVHRSSLGGLQMESNGSLPSAGIQASLTSISSLPYEEDQQQRQLSKLTKSVSAPQISSPEDTEDNHVLPNQETGMESLVQQQDSHQISCSLPNSSFDSIIDEPSLVDSSLKTNHGHILKENVNTEKSNPPHHLLQTYTSMEVLSAMPEVLLLQESVEIFHLKEAIICSQEENVNHQTHIGGASASVEDVHLFEMEVAPCSSGNNQDQEKNNTGGGCQSFHRGDVPLEQACPDPSQTLLVLSSRHSTDLHNSPTTITARPSDLTGLALDELTTSVNLTGGSANDKEPLDCQTKSSKIPNSGLAFVNKKMVEVVNMSVSCAPTCLPFSSVLRDSPSISGMSPRQATSPITHQPLGSFGIISSSSLNPLNMDDETNERMLK